MAQNSSQTVVVFPGTPQVEVAGRRLTLRPDGSLQNLDDWSPDLAEALAAREGLVLTDAHRKVIQVMRDYYAEFNLSPVKKLLQRALQSTGAAELAENIALNQLFPQGVQTQGARLAGIPIPHLDVELERETYNAPVASTAGAGSAYGSFQFEGQALTVTRSGNLVDLHRWSEKLAEFMARKEGIVLTPEHWQVLNYLRQFYFEYGVTPMVKILMKYLGEEFGVAKADREYLYRLFPKGPSRQGSRIAGLPEPQGCIDG